VLGGHSNDDDYQKLREQYHKFYEDDDLKGEGEEDYDEEEAELRRQEVAALRRAQQQEQDEEEREEREGSEVEFAVEIPRRAKSDGEIIDNYQFNLDDSEDDNNISLHSGGDEFYQSATKFGGERESQGGYLEGLRRSEQAERSTVKTQQQQHHGEEHDDEDQQYEEEHEGEDVEDGEELEYEEEYDAAQDPRIQQQYYQMYGQKYNYGPQSENDDPEEEEGYVHESDYEAEYGQEGHGRGPSHGHDQQDVEVDYEDDDQAVYEHEQHQGEEEEDSGHIEHGDGEEQEEAYSAEQARYFHQKDRQKSGDADNEKHVMVSHINSEDDPDAVYQMPETPDTQLYKNLNQQQRRHKSDFVMRPEADSRHSMNVPPEERRSLPYQHNKTVSKEGGRYSQSEDPYRGGNHVGQKRSEQISGLEHYDEGQEEFEEEEIEYEEVEEDVDVEDHAEHRADSEHYREELIEELNQGDRKSLSKRSSQRDSPQRINRSHEKSISQTSEGGKYAVTVLPPEEKKVEVIIDHKYQEELNRLKEEEARKWNDMVKQLGQLQGVSLSSDIKAVIENLQKQSEINKKKTYHRRRRRNQLR